ncbi:MAG: GNAT family N-acetyltransferase [Hyphomicrobiales bacterium]|nr:GNAT family N-acetyltransferase [Hyphomicrobiales bacterium]
MISVRPFEDQHAPALAEIMIEMTRFYGASIPKNARITEDIIGHSKNIDILLAFNREAPVGFATFTTLFPVGGLRSFTYIQQVYVGAAARRLGVAQRLMSAIARTSKARGCQRLEWATARKILPLAPSMTAWERAAQLKFNMFWKAMLWIN